MITRLLTYSLLICSALISGCALPTATGSAEADASLVPTLAHLQFEYAAGMLPPVDDYLPGLSYSSQYAYSAVLVALTDAFEGADAAYYLSHTTDIPAASNYHLDVSTAQLLSTKSSSKAVHFIRCHSVLTAYIPEKHAYYDIHYTYSIALSSSLYATPWDAELHAAKGFTHCLADFKAYKVKLSKKGPTASSGETALASR